MIDHMDPNGAQRPGDGGTPDGAGREAAILRASREAAALVRPWVERAIHDTLERSIERLERHILHLVVAGQFKRGKTTVIDALVGADLLPRAVLPATSVITLVGHGPQTRAAIEFGDGRLLGIPLESLADYVTESGNPRNARGVRAARVEAPAGILAAGITLVDTPGTASVHLHGTEIAHGFLPEADAALFVLSVDPPVSAEELEDVAALHARVPVVICVLNKVDQLAPSDVVAVASFTANQLATAGCGDVPVVPISARGGLEARQRGDQAALATSGLPGLESLIIERVARPARAVAVEGLRRRALAALDAASTAVGLERRSAELGDAEAHRRLERFERVAADVRQAADEESLTLGAGVQRVLADVLPARLAALAHDSAREVDSLLTSRSPSTEAEGVAIIEDAVTDAVTRWVGDVGALLEEAVAPRLAASAERVNRLRERALAEAASIFELAAPPARAVAGDIVPTGENVISLHYEPTGGLELAVAAGRRLMPGRLGHRARMRALRTRAAETIDRHVGRLRAEATREVDECVRTTTRAQRRALDETLRLVERAVERASAREERRHETRGGHRAGLDALTSSLEELKAELGRLGDSADQRQGAADEGGGW